MSEWTYVRGGLEFSCSPFEIREDFKDVSPKREDFETDEAYDEAVDKYRDAYHKAIYLPFPEEQFKLGAPIIGSVPDKTKKKRKNSLGFMSYPEKPALRFDGTVIYSMPKARPILEEAFKLFPQGELGFRYTLEQTNVDGSRIIAMKDNGKVSFWTRQGQPYEGLVDLQTELENSPEDNFVFDGEIVAIDTTKEDTYKNTMKLSRTKDAEKHGLQMLVFDYMPIANFKMQVCGMTYRTRRGVLTAMFDFNNFQYFKLLPKLYQGTDTSKILDILEDQTSKGEEGIMINIVDAPYDFKRTNNLLKVKKFQDTELKIIGFEEGTNKLVGTLGAFICEYKGNTVKVGSGLSDEDRAYFWNNKIKFLGRYITVKYFETSTDSKTGLESLRFPIYMRVREDMPTIPLDVNGPRFDY